MHSKRSALVAAAACLVLAACGATTGSAGPTGGSGAGDLQLTKDCSEAMGAAGDVCIIITSNHEAIEVGSRLVFASASGPDFLDSDIVLDVSPGNFAMGHCTVDLATGSGVCTLAGGAGDFAGFNARVDVDPADPSDPTVHRWSGTYSASGGD